MNEDGDINGEIIDMPGGYRAIDYALHSRYIQICIIIKIIWDYEGKQ